MARQEPTESFPAEIDVTLENFERYKAPWLRYRRIGGYDANGNFIPPISFLEAEQQSKAMMDTFAEMDNLYSIAKRQIDKEKGRK